MFHQSSLAEKTSKIDRTKQNGNQSSFPIQAWKFILQFFLYCSPCWKVTRPCLYSRSRDYTRCVNPKITLGMLTLLETESEAVHCRGYNGPTFGSLPSVQPSSEVKLTLSFPSTCLQVLFSVEFELRLGDVFIFIFSSSHIFYLTCTGKPCCISKFSLDSLAFKKILLIPQKPM